MDVMIVEDKLGCFSIDNVSLSYDAIIDVMARDQAYSTVKRVIGRVRSFSLPGFHHSHQ